MNKKVKKEKIYNTEINGDISAKYVYVPNVYWDLIEHSQNQLLKDVISLIDSKYGIENRFMSQCNSFEARAVCHPDDEYDTKKGTDIAGVKSDWKFHDSMTKRYSRYYDELSDLLDQIERLLMFHSRKCMRIEDYLEEM